MKNILKRLQAGWDKGWKWTKAKWLRFRKWGVSVMVSLGLIVGGMALADDATLSWSNATLNEDGTVLPIEDIAETRLYKQVFPLGTDVSQEPRSYTQVVSLPPTETSYVDADLPNGIHCYVGTHVHVNSSESQYSGEACKTIDVRIPGSPSGMTVN
jgi:hypothetical protein